MNPRPDAELRDIMGDTLRLYRTSGGIVFTIQRRDEHDDNNHAVYIETHRLQEIVRVLFVQLGIDLPPELTN